MPEPRPTPTSYWKRSKVPLRDAPQSTPKPVFAPIVNERNSPELVMLVSSP